MKVSAFQSFEVVRFQESRAARQRPQRENPFRKNEVLSAKSVQSVTFLQFVFTFVSARIFSKRLRVRALRSSNYTLHIANKANEGLGL